MKRKDEVGEVITAQLGKGGVGVVVPATQFAEAVKNLVDAWREYKITREAEKTKRHQITAWKETQLKKIEAQERLVREFMSKAFEERSDVFEMAFKRLDRGLNDLAEKPENTVAVKAIDAALTVIVGQVRQSPIAGLNELMRSMEDESGAITI